MEAPLKRQRRADRCESCGRVLEGGGDICQLCALVYTGNRWTAFRADTQAQGLTYADPDEEDAAFHRWGIAQMRAGAEWRQHLPGTYWQRRLSGPHQEARESWLAPDPYTPAT